MLQTTCLKFSSFQAAEFLITSLNCENRWNSAFSELVKWIFAKWEANKILCDVQKWSENFFYRGITQLYASVISEYMNFNLNKPDTNQIHRKIRIYSI